MHRHLPNILTASRLLLAPYLFLLIWRHQYTPVIYLFILISITDVLDGYLARKWKVASRVGAYLDPVADKVLLSGTFLVLALSGAIESWLAVVVLGRDVLILLVAGILYLAKSRRSFPPSPFGKISTFVQILFICFMVGFLDGIGVGPIVIFLKWVTVALVVVSTLDYARRLQ